MRANYKKKIDHASMVAAEIIKTSILLSNDAKQNEIRITPEYIASMILELYLHG